MPTTPWTLESLAQITELPPTYAGYLQAVEVAAHAATSTAGGSPEEPESGSLANRVVDECDRAWKCMQSQSPAPVNRSTAQRAEAGVDDIRTLIPLIVAATDVGADLLDNEEEPLTIAQVTAIGQALAHLDRARRFASGVDL